MSRGHACGTKLPINSFKVCEKVWVIYIILSKVIEQVCDIAKRKAVASLIFHVINIYLDASIDVLVSIVKEERVLGIVFNATHALRLSFGVIKVLRLEILVIFRLIVRHVTS